MRRVYDAEGNAPCRYQLSPRHWLAFSPRHQGLLMRGMRQVQEMWRTADTSGRSYREHARLVLRQPPNRVVENKHVTRIGAWPAFTLNAHTDARSTRNMRRRVMMFNVGGAGLFSITPLPRRTCARGRRLARRRRLHSAGTRPPDIATHVIKTHFEPSCLQLTGILDAASHIYCARSPPPPRHRRALSCVVS